MRNERELEFAIFVIENVAARLGVSGDRVYRALTRDSDILGRYVVPSYDVLHTQGKEFIVADVLDAMRKAGVSV